MTGCILDPGELPPLDSDELRTLRARVFADGICASDFVTLLEHEDHAFQLVFGENTLLKIEFDVAMIGEHSHMVRIPGRGEEPEIITAYPGNGYLRVARPTPWHESPHSPMRGQTSHQRVAIIATEFSEDDWRRVAIVAEAINEANLNYNFLFQNSNSVVATLAEVAKTAFTDLPGGGLNLGAGNTLFDELLGGRQVPKFLVRGGTSHSGDTTSPVPDSLPKDVDTDA
ncbi:hypothetical protein [Henriciella sp.]|uniref:hypothetical protein n=1 Tax=Henriciella sp. TaxID=1968823 RepID=UPI002615C15B|nr:hypothetical protein [Henriciella sp.]